MIKFNLTYSKKESVTLDGFEIEKLGFERREEGVEKISMDFDLYNNKNVVAMMRKMNYFPKNKPREDSERGNCSSSDNSYGHTTFQVRL